MDFVDYKTEYFQQNTTEERKQELILFMQEELRKRNGNKDNTIKCIDNTERSITSNNVEDLIAIDNTLRNNKKKKQASSASDITRKKAEQMNKYGPTHPYPDK